MIRLFLAIILTAVLFYAGGIIFAILVIRLFHLLEEWHRLQRLKDNIESKHHKAVQIKGGHSNEYSNSRFSRK